MIINAAGVYSDKIHNMVFKESFKITPIRGEYYVFDKEEGKNFSHTIFQCPSSNLEREYRDPNCTWKFNSWT